MHNAQCTMKLETSQDERRARFEMTPMMDVVFLLLVYFIYAVLSMSAHHAVKVDLPNAGGERDPAKNPTVITLDSGNVLTHEKRPVTLDEAVRTALVRWRDEGHPVIIAADRKSETGEALKLLSELKNAGVGAVSFQVGDEK